MIPSVILEKAIEAEAQKQGVDPAVAKAIFRTEHRSASSVSSEVRSPKEAAGIMQVIPSTFQLLKNKGFLPPDAENETPHGQIAAGIAAIKEQ